MKIKQDILNNIDLVSKESLDFLRNKQNDVKNHENLLSKTETSIVKNIGADGMTDSESKIIDNLKKELHNIEYNQADIMREQLFMTKLIQDIQKALGKYNMPYIDAMNKFKGEADKYFNYSGVLEEKFNAIKGENDDKHSLRQKIVHNENKLSKAKEKYESFTKNFAPIYSSIVERDEKKTITEKAKQELINKVGELNKKVSELEAELNKSYEEKVDLKIDLENALEVAEGKVKDSHKVNELFQTNNLEIEEQENQVSKIRDEIGNLDDDCSDDLQELLNQVDELSYEIKQKDEEINTLDSEKDWLLQQNVSQGVEIDTLKNKLRVWESNLQTFRALVKSLAIHVGYPLQEAMLNANGGTDENPLIPLITQLRDITDWVKEQDELIPDEPTTEEVIVEVEKDHSHMGYIIGGALLTALALTMKK